MTVHTEISALVAHNAANGAAVQWSVVDGTLQVFFAFGTYFHHYSIR